jgi:hypothetical protein
MELADVGLGHLCCPSYVENSEYLHMIVSGSAEDLLDIVSSSDVQFEILHWQWLADTQNDRPIQSAVA